jgi:hypothetical protein
MSDLMREVADTVAVAERATTATVLPLEPVGAERSEVVAAA